MTDQAQDTADHIDSEVLAAIYKASKAMDDQPIPMIGRYYWDPETDTVKAVDDL